MVIAYDFPCSLETTLLVIWNSFHIPEINHNLISPFILREAGLQVYEMPKLHATESTQEHHSIYDAETKLCIHLKLKGILSYFPCRKLTHDETENWEEHILVFCTPNAEFWNPNNECYAEG